MTEFGSAYTDGKNKGTEEDSSETVEGRPGFYARSSLVEDATACPCPGCLERLGVPEGVEGEKSPTAEEVAQIYGRMREWPTAVVCQVLGGMMIARAKFLAEEAMQSVGPAAVYRSGRLDSATLLPEYIYGRVPVEAVVRFWALQVGEGMEALATAKAPVDESYILRTVAKDLDTLFEKTVSQSTAILMQTLKGHLSEDLLEETRYRRGVAALPVLPLAPFLEEPDPKKREALIKDELESIAVQLAQTVDKIASLSDS